MNQVPRVVHPPQISATLNRGRRVVLNSEFGGHQPVEAVTWDLVVVVGNPPLGLLAHFGEIAEDVHVEHAAPKGVEPLCDVIRNSSSKQDQSKGTPYPR